VEQPVLLSEELRAQLRDISEGARQWELLEALRPAW
jgi:hypothetical protein